MAQHH